MAAQFVGVTELEVPTRRDVPILKVGVLGNVEVKGIKVVRAVF